MKTVAIIGVGPAGLMAAHACKLAGVPFHLFGLGDKSKLGGAQFLHKPLPLLNDDEPDFTLAYRLRGEASTYREKVYGTSGVPFVSMENVQDGQVVPAWSLERSYGMLWADIAGDGASVNVLDVTPEVVLDWQERDTFGLIVSTIPKTAMCNASARGLSHHFWSQDIRIMNETVLDGSIEANTIVYDGTPDVSWYRTSLINGIGSTEWGTSAPKVMPYKTVTARKPVRTTCDCFDGTNVLFTGRYGAWTKGLLAHDAFVHTWKALEG